MNRKIRISKVDSLVSNYIRNRADWICERCGSVFTPPTSGLHCAHFFGRSNKATRFDPENLLALCYGCHSYFDGSGREDFRAFMKHKLGVKKFNELCKRGRSIMKESEAISKAMEMLSKNI